MAIAGTTTNYSGRTVDMYISGTLNPLSSATQTVTYSFGSPSKYVAGIQKLAQRYLISLLNSGFIDELGRSTSGNLNNARRLFNQYNWDIVTSFRKYQASNTNLNKDEELNTTTLNSMSVVGDAVNISINLASNAGDTITFVLPLPLT